MQRILQAVFFVIIVAGCAGTWPLASRNVSPPSLRSDRLSLHPRGSTEADNGYLAYLPPGYGDGPPRPLLVFWHGVGENGNGREELARVAETGLPMLIDQGRWPTDRDWVVLSPQHHSGGCPTSSEIRSFFDYAVTAYDVDPDRVYLTGLSCGAIGGWSYLAEHRGTQVAAAVLIAGNGARAMQGAGCIDVPIWAFHGDADTTVGVEGSIEAMDALSDCPNPEQRVLTIYEGVAHDSWTQTYDGTAGHDIYAWLGAFRR